MPRSWVWFSGTCWSNAYHEFSESVCRIECMNVNVGRQFTGIWESLMCPFIPPKKTDRYFFLSLSLSAPPPPPINPSFYYLHLAQSSQTLEGVRITALRLYSLTRLCCFIHEQTEIQRRQIEKECECFSAKWSVIELLCNRYDGVCASTWWKTGRIFHHIDILKILTHN